MDEVDIKDYLSKTNDTFRGLLEQHQAFEHELESLSDKPYLNPQEQLREIEIKKKKLVLKDQMQVFISQYLQTQQASG